MPYNPNADWTARTNAAAKSPVYYIAIDGLTTKHYSTGPVLSAATTKNLLLNVPDSIGQKLSQLRGSHSMTLFTVELVDRDNEITDLVSTEKSGALLPTLVNRKVTLFSGYADLTEDKYAAVGVGQIAGVELVADRLTYRLTLRDVRRHETDDVFTNAEAGRSKYASALVSAVAVGTTKIEVVGSPADLTKHDADAPAAGDKLFLGPSTDASYLGQEEKLEIGNVIVGPPHFIEFTTALTKAYAIGDEVRWATALIEGNPINILRSVWTGNFAHASFPLAKKSGMPTGLSVPATEVADSELITERDYFYGDEVWRFEIQRPIRGQRFVEKLVQLLGYPRTKIDGRLSFRMFRPWLAEDAVAGLPQILEADILSWRMRRSNDLHVNQMIVGVDFEPEGGEPAQTVTVEDAADQTATKEISKVEPEETGIRGALRGVRLAEERGQVFLTRFQIPPIQYLIECDLRKRALEVGEVVELTHSAIPDVTAGARGLTKKRLEIVERTERFDSSRIDLTLQASGFSRPMYIAPDTVGDDYDTASAADKEYGYIAPDAGNFADGGVPYEIT